MMDEMTLTLNSPLTEEQWDAITDVDLENTPRIMFRTKHGQEVWYEKRKTGKWIERWHENKHVIGDMACSVCGAQMLLTYPRFCPYCGAEMRGEQ